MASRTRGPVRATATAPAAAVSGPPPKASSTWLRDYALVAEAIAALDADAHRPGERVTMSQLAASLHVSTGHLQRTFARFAGTSPARFVRWLTADAARELLAERRSVLATTTELGLSSPGRLHDLLVTVDGVTPGEVGTGGAGLTIRAAFQPTPFGLALAAETERGLLALRFVDDPVAGTLPGTDEGGGSSAPAGSALRATAAAGDASTTRDGSVPGSRSQIQALAVAQLQAEWPRATVAHDPDAGRAAVALLADLGNTDTPAARLPVGPVGTNLQLKVWEALLRIPDDGVVTYAQVAAAVDRPDAVRAVAGAIGRNPIATLIPCHRVLRGTGELGGYAWGTVRKRALLAREAARVAS